MDGALHSADHGAAAELDAPLRHLGRNMRPRHPDDRIQGRPRPGRQPRAALGCGAHLRRHLLLRARVHAVRAGVHTLQDAAGCAAALLLHRRVGAARHCHLDRRCHRAELEELYEKYLTKAMKAKLNATQKAKVQAAILEKAILAEVDHKVAQTSAGIAKEIRDMAKGL